MDKFNDKIEQKYLKSMGFAQEKDAKIHFEATVVTVSPYTSGRSPGVYAFFSGVLGAGFGFIFACFQNALMRSYRRRLL